MGLSVYGASGNGLRGLWDGLLNRLDPNRSPELGPEGPFDPVVQGLVGGGAADAGAKEPYAHQAVGVDGDQLKVAAVLPDGRPDPFEEKVDSRAELAVDGRGLRRRAAAPVLRL